MRRRFRLPTDSVAFKLFLITSAVFVGLLTALMVAQLFFFEPYYTFKKESDLRTDLTALRDRYAAEPYPPGRIPPYFVAFEEEHDALSAIGDIGDDGQIRLTIGLGGDQERRPIVRRFESPGFGDPFLGPRLAITDLEREKLILGIAQWANDEAAYRRVIDEGETIVRYSDLPLPGLEAAKHMLLVSPLPSADGGPPTLLFAVSSLQPIGDAASALGDMYIAMYALAIAVVLLLSFVYSGMITKPLRLMNRVAHKMARLDFTERSPIRRRDEIGNLSETLNFLSDNLQDALRRLQESNAQLQADIEREKKLERMRREFVAAVSHELKTPISLIGGYAEALQDNLGDERRKAYYVEVILDEAAQMEKLVRDMIDLSQLESGRYRIRPTVFDLGEAIADAASKLEPHLGGRELILETDPVDVRADPFRIGQVLTNLIGNAMRHTREGGALGVSAKRVAFGADAANGGDSPGNGHGIGGVKPVADQAQRGVDSSDDQAQGGAKASVAGDGRYVRITVWNEGEPIPEEELEHIWSHFYRVEKSRHRDHGGSGIGLAIVRQILRLHDSPHGVRNTGNGVEFYFLLREAER